MERITEGWIYMMTNESMPDLIKIGYSGNDPVLRAEQLSSTGTPTPFKVIYRGFVKDAYGLEQKLHNAFYADRVSDNREFFKTDPSDVYDKIHKIDSPKKEDIDYDFMSNHQEDEEEKFCLHCKELEPSKKKCNSWNGEHHFAPCSVEYKWEEYEGHKDLQLRKFWAQYDTLVGRDYGFYNKSNFDLYKMIDKFSFKIGEIFIRDGYNLNENSISELKSFENELISEMNLSFKEFQLYGGSHVEEDSEDVFDVESAKEELTRLKRMGSEMVKLAKGKNYPYFSRLSELEKLVQESGEKDNSPKDYHSNKCLRSIGFFNWPIIFHRKVDPICKKIEKTSMIVSFGLLGAFIFNIF